MVTRAERGKLVAFGGLGIALGPALGPIIGGLLTETLGWQRHLLISRHFLCGAVLGLLGAYTRDGPARTVVGNGSVPPHRAFI